MARRPVRAGAVEAEVRIGWASVEGSEEREDRKSADVLMESDLEASEEDMRAAIGCGGGFGGGSGGGREGRWRAGRGEEEEGGSVSAGRSVKLPICRSVESLEFAGLTGLGCIRSWIAICPVSSAHQMPSMYIQPLQVAFGWLVENGG